ncbi:hypothetical protein NECAME_09090 [Necator americanus]|uniref:Uncharacterized protein n=1 Tax=Necator americanus TaxID=51031 RepID=W2THP8_NECAM|nr:hypothetical protein NECAME_09090 [Necator americanus]ETN80542.1 hypothetical protein NECAME_09090 [Necator americanus]
MKTKFLDLLRSVMVNPRYLNRCKEITKILCCAATEAVDSLLEQNGSGSDYRLLRGRFSFTRTEEKAAKCRERNLRTTINWDLFATLASFWEDSAMDNIDEEYDWLVEHHHDCAKKAESFKTTKRRLSLETLGLG